MKTPLKQTWKLRIKRALLVGHFTELDKQKVSLWDTCAVAEFKPPRFHGLIGLYGTPRDPDLAALGYKFADAVIDDKILVAARLYKKMQSLAVNHTSAMRSTPKGEIT